MRSLAFLADWRVRSAATRRGRAEKWGKAGNKVMMNRALRNAVREGIAKSQVAYVGCCLLGVTLPGGGQITLVGGARVTRPAWPCWPPQPAAGACRGQRPPAAPVPAAAAAAAAPRRPHAAASPARQNCRWARQGWPPGHAETGLGREPARETQQLGGHAAARRAAPARAAVATGGALLAGWPAGGTGGREPAWRITGGGAAQELIEGGSLTPYCKLATACRAATPARCPHLHPASPASHLQLGRRQRVRQQVLLVCCQLGRKRVCMQVMQRQLPRQVRVLLRMLCMLCMWRRAQRGHQRALA